MCDLLLKPHFHSSPRNGGATALGGFTDFKHVASEALILSPQRYKG
ncbi:hypothetical protein [Nostoc sp.]